MPFDIEHFSKNDWTAIVFNIAVKRSRAKQWLKFKLFLCQPSNALTIYLEITNRPLYSACVENITECSIIWILENVRSNITLSDKNRLFMLSNAGLIWFWTLRRNLPNKVNRTKKKLSDTQELRDGTKPYLLRTRARQGMQFIQS